ncbi:MAG TPA: SIR2 family protein [Thermoanaerobaculia bacterium]|jgi:hypothetical protein|nr:SIR2 family protein [Thermoanaerobaculia bacterium]
MIDSDDSSFGELVAAMKRTPRPLALLGAGTSVDSGYPTWNRLLEILEERAKTKGRISPKYQEILKGLNDAAWRAEEYRRLMGDDNFRGIIASEFAPKGTIGNTLRTIVRLGFRHILTTNYDSSIERAFEEEERPLQVVDWTDEVALRKFFLDLSRHDGTPYLVYLHGRFFDPAKIVLTESSYASRYARSDDAQRKLFAILITQPVVFIGFSVTDPDLDHIMREVNARLGTGNPQHFALVGYEVDEQRELIRNRFEGKYGIRAVFYRITRNDQGREDHSYLAARLRDIYQEIYPSDKLFKEATSIDVSMRSYTLDRNPALETSEETPAFNPLDQQKNRWGGRPERNGRRLKVENIQERHSSCVFDLVVEPWDNAPPLEGEVRFHLHQTFNPSVVTAKVEGGQVRRRIIAIGAFTVGAEADSGETRLELDLAEVEDFP